MEDKEKTVDSNDNAEDGKEQKKRSVVISPIVEVLFKHKSGSETEVVRCNRDVYSVTDTVGQKLAALKGKEEMDDILVSVHSIEDESKSDPPSEGEDRWKGDYMVGGANVEDMPIPEAMTELAKAIIPNDVAVKGVERLAEQYFLRTRLDGFVFIATFDGQPVVVPLISSFKEISPECLAILYRQMHIQAENLKAWIGKRFPEVAAKVNWTGETEKKSGLVAPDGTPVESRKPQAPVLRFQGGCGKSCKK